MRLVFLVLAVHFVHVLAIKVAIIGTFGVGKSSFLRRWVTGQPVPENLIYSTAGGSYSKIIEPIPDSAVGAKLSLEVWDTAGQERFHALLPMYTRDAQVLIMVYDVSDPGSITGALKMYLKSLQNAKPDCIAFVVGMKKDLLDEQGVAHHMNDVSQSFNEVGYKGYFLASSRSLEGDLAFEKLKADMVRVICQENFSTLVQSPRTDFDNFVARREESKKAPNSSCCQ